MAQRASAGHKIGQLIGDWFEEFFVLPLLAKVSEELDLYLDNRFIDRPARGEKIIWQDVDGNKVDYDFVLELNGSQMQIGIPVAFIESCWRRGSRHSKDKARDDSGKLRPMRATYPSARFLGMVVSGDFTGPARELVRNRDIDLFYISKETVVRAFSENGFVMDYPDKSTEEEKQRIAAQFEADFTTEKRLAVANSLIQLMGKAVVDSYVDRVKSKLSALPQEIRFILQHNFPPIVFESIDEATKFLQNPAFQMDNPTESYVYQVIYSDGSEFEQSVASLERLRELHRQITTLADHMNKLS
jgi:hypothetical protein